LWAKRGSGAAGSGKSTSASSGSLARSRCSTDGPNEVVRVEGDYRPRQIDSADVVEADAFDPCAGPLTLLSNGDDWELRIKHACAHASIFYRNNPTNVVGWKGDLFRFKLNVRDVRPIMSDRIHFAPSAWVAFEAAGVVE
jgi:homogentisate 1,2-dioxygenase